MRMSEKNNLTVKDYIKFIIPSLLGVFLLMVPIKVNGEITLIVAVWADFIEDNIGSLMPYIAMILMFISFFGALITRLFQPVFIDKRAALRDLFDVGPIALLTRTLGFLFVILVVFQIGPEAIWSEDTGTNILDLVTTLIAIFLFAGYVLPLLLDFGLLELFGIIMKKIMRPIFTLPGRSSIDSLVSWLGDGTIGVMLTNKQYEEGYYTKREAAVIGTTFSLVSIDFTIVILLQLNLEHLFIPYYGTIVVAGIVAALIMPRIPPLSRKEDTYYEQVKPQEEEEVPEGMSLFKWGMTQAAERAKATKSLAAFHSGTRNVL